MKPSVSFLALIFVLFSPFLLAADRDPSPGDSDKVSGRAIIHEMNTARQNPKLYAIFLEQTRQNYPGRGRLCARDGVRTVDEAIRFLRCTRPVPPLALSPGLCSAASDHCREQAGGAVGHRGRGGSDPGSRISRYGVVAQDWAENICYGQRSVRAIVMAPIIDDGVRARGHRTNIFNPNYDAAGAAYGLHAGCGNVCVSILPAATRTQRW